MDARNMLEVLEALDKRGMRGFSGGLAYAFNVKAYGSAADCSAEEFEDVQADHGIDAGFSAEWIRKRFEDGTSEDYWEGAESFARTDAWEDAGEFLKEIADGRLDFLSLEQDGRSGGWAVLRGLDADALEDCARDFSRLEGVRFNLQKARPKERADSESVRLWEEELRTLAEDLGLPDYLERLRALAELVSYEEVKDAEEMEETVDRLRERLLLDAGDALPAPEDLEPETDAGDAWSLEELGSLVGALQEWEEFVRGAVSAFPRLVLWHCGGIYEREKAEADEELRDFERTQAEEDARGALVSAVLRTADALVERTLPGQWPKDWRDAPLDAGAVQAYQDARSALVQGVPHGTRVSLRRVGA